MVVALGAGRSVHRAWSRRLVFFFDGRGVSVQYQSDDVGERPWSYRILFLNVLAHQNTPDGHRRICLQDQK
jgi:hypothetical protein